MKRALCISLVSLAACLALQADTITLWDFNFPTTGGTGDGNALTGTFVPYVGSGTLINIGGTTNSFGSPPSGGMTATSDPWVSDNSALRLGVFPAVGAANKTAGIQFFASTVGYENIKVTWDQENSATASLYWRVQYTTNGGTNWTDHIVVQAAGSTSWVLQRSADFSTVPGVANNPNFGFRLVSEWQSTATGTGAASYIGQTSGYSVNGTLWVDMVTLSGTVYVVGNTDPSISAIADQSVRANQSLGPISFTIGDLETPASDLQLSFNSSNPSLIQNYTFGGSESNRTVSMTPEANQYGSAQITVTVTDGGGKGASSLFNVVVRQPDIVISNLTIRANSAVTNAFTIADYDSFLGTVSLSVDSTNTDLLPPASIVFGGSGANRTMRLAPVADQLGNSLVTVTATDGSLTTTSALFLKVVSTNTIVLWDFDSKIRDNNETTGDSSPALGAGTATSCGTATATLNTALAAESTDPDHGPNNTMWRFGTFPTQGTSNKTSGAELRFSTVGYQNIAMAWDHYNSATCSRYWQVQYSLDGVNFTDFMGYVNTNVTTWFSTNTSFTAIAGANNNPNFAVRLVSEQEGTALGTSSTNYVGVQASGGYSTAGTLWLDMISFTGDPYAALPPPVQLAVAQLGNVVEVSWSANAAAATLQSTLSLSPTGWQNYPQLPAVRGDKNVVGITNATGARFFRLVR